MAEIVIKTVAGQVDHADGMRVYQAMLQGQQVKSVNTWRRSLVTWALVVGLAVLLIFLFDQSTPTAPGPRRPNADSPWALLVFLGLTCLGMIVMVSANRLATRIEARKRKDEEIIYRLREDGIGIDRPSGRVFYRWGFFGRFGESSKSFVLVGKYIGHGRTMFLVLPKAACGAEAEVSRVRDVLQASVLPEAKVDASGQWVQV